MSVRRPIVVALCAWTAVAAAGGRTPRIAPGVTERFADRERVDVVVALRPPALAARSRHSLRQRRAEIAERQADVIAHVLAHAGLTGLTIQYRFATASGFTASVTRAGLAVLAEHADVVRVELPQTGGAALATSVPQINADVVRALGTDGRGVTVAVLDTALDTAHPDLQGHILAEECFCTGVDGRHPCCPGNTSRASGPGSATTTNPAVVHGTHVTGIIVSQGMAVAAIGVAPGAQVLAIRVLDDNARGNLADWLAGLDWLAANPRPDLRAANMSLVSDTLYPVGCEPLNALNALFREVIDTLRAQRMLVFAASGNTFNATMLAAPACVDTAVAVGAVDHADQVAGFSNSNAGLDLLAPGVAIRSTAPNASTAVLSGTSMATPHAVGVAALVWSASPDLEADEVEATLRRTGAPVYEARNGLTFPRVDALAAYRALQLGGRVVLGGGSRLTDCLVEWAIDPPAIVQPHTRLVAVCHDGDPACDRDQLTGQCTFSLSLCFNVPDGRVPHCFTDDPITGLTILSPRADASDPVDRANAAAITAALPKTPIIGTTICTAPMAIVVPIGPSGRGTRMLRLAAAAGERRDVDRARLTCLAPQ